MTRPGGVSALCRLERLGQVRQKLGLRVLRGFLAITRLVEEVLERMTGAVIRMECVFDPMLGEFLIDTGDILW